MTGPGSCMRLTWRRLLWGLALAVAVAALPGVCAAPASAQNQLTLADFNATGLDSDLLALVQTGSVANGTFTVLYRTLPAVGSLLEGELGLGSGNSALSLIEWRGDTVNDLRVQNGSDLDLSAYFGTGGTGADLTIRVQTAGGTGSGTLQNSGASVAPWDMDADAKTILDGLSDGDRMILAFTRPGQPPAQVQNVVVTAASDTSVDVSWDAAARADGYRVEWGTNSGVYTGNAVTTATSYTITNLQAGTTYFVRVTATRTGIADGAPSAEASGSTLAGAPAQVTGVSAVSAAYNAINASWTAVADATGYVVDRDDNATFGSPTSATIASGSTVSHAIGGLQEGTAYYVRVRATKTGAVDGPWSAAASATTSLQPPAQVTNLTAGSPTDVTVDLSWSAAPRADGYQVQWRTSSQTWDASREAVTASLTYQVSGLSASTGYQFRVRATRTGADPGPYSAVATASTAAPLPVDQITGVSAVSISYREIQVTWAAVANAMGYLVQWDLDRSFPDPEQAEVSNTGAIIERLRAETEYFVRVRGKRYRAPDGPWSAPDSATTLDARVKVWADRFPGGQVPAQLFLAAFAGVLAGVRFKGMRSPRREAVITGSISAGALILPMFGLANNFWVIGIALLILLCSVAAIFLARR